MALFVFVRVAGINGRVALTNVALMRVPPLYEESYCKHSFTDVKLLLEFGNNILLKIAKAVLNPLRNQRIKSSIQ